MTNEDYQKVLQKDFNMTKRGTGGNFFPFHYASEDFDYLIAEELNGNHQNIVYKYFKDEDLEGSEIDQFEFYPEMDKEEFKSFLKSILI